MTTYNTGTVSVTNGSATVTGSGTAWAVSLVTGGMFTRLGLAIPIASVESDTSLTLAYVWPGSTAAGAAYAIARESSDAATVVDLYDRLSAVLVNLSLAGIHPSASGTIAQRNAITLGVADEGFIFLYVEIGFDMQFYRWSGTGWVGPFALRGVPGVGAGGYGLPTGGTTGQFLKKASGTDGDSSWATPAASAVSNDSGVSGSFVKDALNTLSSSIATAAANVGKRGTVRAATTANIVISTALNAADALDGVTLAAGDLVLVKNQTTAAENGIYVVGATPARSSEYDTYNEHPGALIVVQEGTTLADTFWYCTSNVGGTLGTTAIGYSQMTISLSDDSVTNAKLANVATATIKGRATAGTGDPEDLTLAQVKALLLSSTVIRDVLTANRTYFVATTGSNSNDGLTSGTPFLTIAKAVSVVQTIDNNGFAVTISVADGTYTAGATISGPFTGNGSVSIVGNVTTPANCIINATSANILVATNGAMVTIKGIKGTTTTVGSVLYAAFGGFITFDKMDFGTCAGPHTLSADGGMIYATLSGSYTISGGAVSHNHSFTGGRTVIGYNTVTLTGTPAFSAYFAGVAVATIVYEGTTWSGAATGQRFVVYKGGVIDTNLQGFTFLPGSVAGQLQQGGEYDLSLESPVASKSADFTVATYETSFAINKGSACVATLPNAVTFPGRRLYFNSEAAFAVTSASANVVPKSGGAASTALLPATAGAWALLISNGTAWKIMMSGT